MKSYLTLLIITLSALTTFADESKDKLETGDIIFTSSRGAGQVEAVKAATNSKWTHTAVIIIVKGNPMVLEAVQPVQFITLKSYLDRGGKDRFHMVKRLKDRSKLTPEAVVKADTWAKKHLGNDYDGRFQWSDKTLYCSELVWKIYNEATDIQLCKIRQVKDYNLKHPTVQELIKIRYGSIDKLNLEEQIVAPSDIFQSDLLKTIQPIELTKKKTAKASTTQ